MAFLEVHDKNHNEIILNTPNRNEILKEGPPQNSKCNILGRGAYGTVFKAIFRAKQVAVKIVKNMQDINLQSMRNEANILGWEHRNIVKILKIETTPNFGIVIMERFSGHCLQLILDTVTLPLEHRVFISLDILSALSYCHKRKLLHLDVKPQNVLVSLEKCNNDFYNQNLRLSHRRNVCYICKLCDFGSSLKISEQQENATKGVARGTVRYMSPEALREEPLTTAADIYSLGITMWQLQHRTLPYSCIECNEVVAYQVVKNELRPDSDVGQFVDNFSPQSALQLHRHCFCENFSSEMSYQCLKHIKDFLNHREQEAKQVLHFSECKLNRRLEVFGSRKPFQILNSKSNSNSYSQSKSNVVRDLRAELDLITPLECGVDFNLAAIFRATCGIQNSIQNEGIYELLYKTCWRGDARSRPKSAELRKQLELLI